MRWNWLLTKSTWLLVTSSTWTPGTNTSNSPGAPLWILILFPSTALPLTLASLFQASPALSISSMQPPWTSWSLILNWLPRWLLSLLRPAQMPQLSISTSSGKCSQNSQPYSTTSSLISASWLRIMCPAFLRRPHVWSSCAMLICPLSSDQSCLPACTVLTSNNSYWLLLKISFISMRGQLCWTFWTPFLGRHSTSLTCGFTSGIISSAVQLTLSHFCLKPVGYTSHPSLHRYQIWLCAKDLSWPTWNIGMWSMLLCCSGSASEKASKRRMIWQNLLIWSFGTWESSSRQVLVPHTLYSIAITLCAISYNHMHVYKSALCWMKDIGEIL